MRVAIVGLGLMGGSLGLALRERAQAEVVGWDPDPAAGAAATARGCLDRLAGSLEEACAGADVAIVAAPVAQLPAAVAAALAAVPEDATVTDIGSTKANIVRSVARESRSRFVGGHPVCGAEARGAQAARPEIFVGATWFLTPVADTDPARYARLVGLITAIGARPVAIDPQAHDRLIAITSHVPHVLANLLATQAGDQTIDGHDPLAATGGSFRDMTRVAGANPRIWVDIFTDNRDALVDALRDQRRRLDEVIEALDSDDAGYLARWIGRSSDARRRALEAQHHAPAADLHSVRINIPDRPGVIAGITQALGANKINVEDFVLHHHSPEIGGVVELIVAGRDSAERAVAILDAQGYGAIAAPLVQDAETPEEAAR